MAFRMRFQIEITESKKCAQRSIVCPQSSPFKFIVQDSSRKIRVVKCFNDILSARQEWKFGCKDVLCALTSRTFMYIFSSKADTSYLLSLATEKRSNYACSHV